MTDPGKIKLLVSDVDGTLITGDKVLTERTRRAVLALKDKGIRFAICSGRPPRGMEMFVEPLDLEEPIAAYNGGAITTPQMKVLEAHALPGDVAGAAVQRLSSLGLDVWLYLPQDWLLRDPDGPHVAREAWTVKFQARVVEDYTPYLAQTAKIVGVSDDYPRVAKAEADESRALSGRASVSRSQPYYLDITSPLANKAHVVEYLARSTGIPLDAICTAGDGLNDVLMFEKSGFSIAMGNASDEVKSKAHEVTASNEEDGLAKAIEKFLLA